MPTNQEAFDKALRGVVSQGKPSYRNWECLYRGPNNTRCAIGHLIPDELYDPKMEGQAVARVDDLLNNTLKEIGYKEEQFNFLINLQYCHDCAAAFNYSFVNRFKNMMRNLADRYNLKYEEPNPV